MFLWRRQPTHRATARALVRDPAGRWLIVRPRGRDHWLLPGGKIEHKEPPTTACHRELLEEVAVDLPTGPLLAVGWRPGRRGRFLFVFDMGAHDGLRIRLQESELSAWQWAAPEDALPLLRKDVAALLTAFEGAPVYREG